jgi:hypothetical protein
MHGVAIGCLVAGAVMALVGAAVGTLARKPEVTVSELLRAGSSLAAHPERYVAQEHVRLVRTLNWTSVAAFLVGVLALLLAGAARFL